MENENIEFAMNSIMGNIAPGQESRPALHGGAMSARQERRYWAKRNKPGWEHRDYTPGVPGAKLAKKAANGTLTLPHGR